MYNKVGTPEMTKEDAMIKYNGMDDQAREEAASDNKRRRNTNKRNVALNLAIAGLMTGDNPVWFVKDAPEDVQKLMREYGRTREEMVAQFTTVRASVVRQTNRSTGSAAASTMPPVLQPGQRAGTDGVNLVPRVCLANHTKLGPPSRLTSSKWPREIAWPKTSSPS